MPASPMSDPFADLTEALASIQGGGDEVRVDAHRRRRTGAPEVVLAAGKTDAQIVAAIERLLAVEALSLIHI